MDLDLGDTRAIIAECRKQGLLRNQAAYVLATAFWETARTVKPVREYGGEKYLKSKRYYPYVGMGYVQLTWKKNYERASKAFGVDFVAKPRLLLDPKYATPILVTGMREGWFTGKKLSDYITLKVSDFKAARRIVNGVDKAAEIAALAVEYDTLLKAERYGDLPADPPPPSGEPQDGTKPNVVLVPGPAKDETTVVVVPTPDNPPQNNPMPTSKRGLAVFGAMILAIIAAVAKYFGG
jgi:hypothetical protein